MRFSPDRHAFRALRAICLLLAIVLSPVILFSCAVLLGASLALGLATDALIASALCVLLSVLFCALLWAAVRQYC